jgi:hypothetical protein
MHGEVLRLVYQSCVDWIKIPCRSAQRFRSTTFLCRRRATKTLFRWAAQDRLITLWEDAIPSSRAGYPYLVCATLLLWLTLVAPTVARAQELSPDVRALETGQQLTDDERFSLIISILGPAQLLPRDPRFPEGVPASAGYTPGVPRLGVPALRMSDASLGVTNPGYRPDDKGATALPASILVGASFNPRLARDGGVMLGCEARMRGFNVMLAGGVNLARDVRNGRNFEYYSEDPLVMPSSAPRPSAASRARASSQRSNTTPSTTTRPIVTGWTRSSSRRRTASPTCSRSRSPSSARSPARS